MKKLVYIFQAAAFMMFAVSCEQEVVNNSANPCPSNDPSIVCPEAPPPADCPDNASAGDADFTKFVSIGTSYTAGFQAGALFTEGQNNSLAKILANQFECVGGGAFNQPSINSEHGYNIFISPNPVGTTVLGRFKLQGTPPAPAPMVAGSEAIPNPLVNPAFVYAGDKSALNNFAVQAIFLRQLLTPAAGDWTQPNPALGFTPFYARFASDPGNSTILGDALVTAPSFFMFWMGMDDYLLYAAFGGDGTKAPLTPADGGVGVGFTATYGYVMSQILGSNPELKGVIANFPNPFAMPHFRAVPYNPIPMGEAEASAANSGYTGYNQILEALKGPPFNKPAAEVDARKISFAVGNNPFVIVDETLESYGDEFDGLQAAQMITAEQRAQLVPLEQVRMTTSSDIIPLSAGAVLGTLADPQNPASVRGVGVPMADQYVLIPSEILEIETARAAYNAALDGIAAAYSDRIALADINGYMNTFIGSQGTIIDELPLVPLINPPVGIFSEDGLHPNNRGYAFIAHAFIDAINTKFNASVPKPRIGKYTPTGFPINP